MTKGASYQNGYCSFWGKCVGGIGSFHTGNLSEFIIPSDGQLNLSTDTAVAQAKSFLRIMAQPVDQNALKQVLLTEEEVRRLA